MPKVAEELTALDVKRLVYPGGKRNVLFSVGGVTGLYLQITPKGGRSWVLRIKVGALRRDIGLGSHLRAILALFIAAVLSAFEQRPVDQITPEVA